jgi:tRNA A37 threonylcarbamoyladenosine synthetase subunit TsaC/SUA5/YrdC
MTTEILGLPDAEIDRLLAEAESRLSRSGSSDAGPVATATAAKVPATATAVLKSTAEEQTAVSKKSEELAVRVPQLAQKKKVCVRPCSFGPLAPRVL